ncbi:MAG: hypothetical protein L0332_17625, partial [Chloroflexi bacterium]|nr:hypothetical protein [Chloroflexota bacterium]
MTDIERLQLYLDELASQRETPDAAELAEADLELADAIATLAHPALPPAVDAGFQARLLAASQPAATVEPAGENDETGLDRLREVLANAIAGLRARFTPGEPTGENGETGLDRLR